MTYIARYEHIFQDREMFLSQPRCNSTPMFSYVYLAWWIVALALFVDLFIQVLVLVIGVVVGESVGVKVTFADDDG